MAITTTSRLVACKIDANSRTNISVQLFHLKTHRYLWLISTSWPDPVQTQNQGNTLIQHYLFHSPFQQEFENFCLICYAKGFIGKLRPFAHVALNWLYFFMNFILLCDKGR